MFIKHKSLEIQSSVSSVNRQTVPQTRRRNTEGTFTESQSSTWNN